MTEIERYRLSLTEYFSHLFHVGEDHPFPDLPFAHGHHLDCFHEVIAKVMIELCLYPAQILLVLLRKRLLQVFPDDIPAILQNVSDDDIYDI